MNNKCRIFGFNKFKNKSEEEILRIVIGIESQNQKYYGLIPTTVFLKSNNNLIEILKYSIDTKEAIYYTCSNNIVTGKTKIINFTLDEQTVC